MRLMLFSYMFNLVGYAYLPIAMSLFLRLEIFMFQRINPQRVVVGHRDALHEAQDDEMMKIYRRLPQKAQLLVRDPDPRQNFVYICSFHCTGQLKYAALLALSGFVNKS